MSRRTILTTAGSTTRFREFLQAQPDFLLMLDVSSKEHLFGVALEGDTPATLADNRLAYEARHVRLFMQPQVQWEPVQIEPNELVPSLKSEIIHSTMNGGPTLVGANTVTLVPALPGWIAGEIVSATRQERPAAALFSLPFGLKAMARLSPPEPVGLPVTPPGATTEIHEPSFGDLASAKQVRIRANNTLPGQELDPARLIPGMIRQLKNFVQPNQSNLTSITPDDVAPFVNGFPGISREPGDLSGYGLSTFSEWAKSTDGAGFVQGGVPRPERTHIVRSAAVPFHALRMRLAAGPHGDPGAPQLRTRVPVRTAAGTPSSPGVFLLPLTFEKVRSSFRSRTSGASASRAPRPFRFPRKFVMEPVIFDADVELEGHAALVPIYDRPGYVELPARHPRRRRTLRSRYSRRRS